MGGERRAQAGLGTLYVVATPIGNLGDITYRAVEVLGRVSLVAAEDTRHTGVLLSHLGIDVPTVSLFEHNEASRIPGLLERLGRGEDVALVSDAGTPLVSDPGGRLVAAAIEAGLPVVPVPGASSVTAALSVAGLGTEPFQFIGFLPKKRRQLRDALAACLRYQGTSVAFAPGRSVAQVVETLRELAPEAHVVLARELTKLHEELVRGTAGAIDVDAITAKGELVVLVAPPEAGMDEPLDDEAILALLREALEGGATTKAAVDMVRSDTGLPRKRIYSLALGLVKE